jgi:hypothetical protein
MSENQPVKDAINPAHYRGHSSGVECIEIVRHFGFSLGNAVKYLWRWKDKNGVEDLKKSLWYFHDALVPPTSGLTPDTLRYSNLQTAVSAEVRATMGKSGADALLATVLSQILWFSKRTYLTKDEELHAWMDTRYTCSKAVEKAIIEMGGKP